jgi:hypothetical protein
MGSHAVQLNETSPTFSKSALLIKGTTMKVLAAMLAAYDKVIDFIEARPQTSFFIFAAALIAALVF